MKIKIRQTGESQLPAYGIVACCNGDNSIMKKYRFSFEIWGLLLFLIVMLPTFIWLAIPAPNDILRENSITEMVDAIASVCQIAMVAALCILRNRDAKKLCVTPSVILSAGCCVLYFISWIVYYIGMINAPVILGLTIPPCLAFLFFAIDRKNGIAIIPIVIFTLCHLIYGVVNFII